MKQTHKSLISLVTTVCFFLTQLCFGPPALAVGSKIKTFSSFPPLLSIPPDLGILQYYVPSLGYRAPREVLAEGTRHPAPFIIHIQTAHGNYQAQKKIEALLHYLKSTYGINLLFVEGSAFELEPDVHDITLPMAEALTKKALLKGGDLFLLKEKDFKAFGIENVEAYRSNLEAFRAVLKAKEKTDRFVEQMSRQIEYLTSPYLNKNLRDFLARLEHYETKLAPILGWLSELKNYAKKHLELDLSDPVYQLDWPTLVRIYKLEEFESKMDRKLFDKEREAFLKAIRNIPREIYKEVEKLLSLPIFLPAGRQTAHQLLDPHTRILFEKMVQALPTDFHYEAYPHVGYFIGHLILRSEIKAERLTEEMRRLEDQIAEQLASTVEEKKIISLLKDYRLLKKLFALELMPEDYETIMKRNYQHTQTPVTAESTGDRVTDDLATSSLRPSVLVSRFLELDELKRSRKAKFDHLEEIDLLFDKAMEFYAGVKDRDHWMLENITRRLKEAGSDKAVVITGGFHAGPFREYFENQNFGYALITPAVTEIGSRDHYLRAMLQDVPNLFSVSTVETPELLHNRTTLKLLTPDADWYLEQIEFARRSEVRNKKGVQFSLDTTIKRILDLFSSEPQRKELPTLRELSLALGPSQSTFSLHFPEILKALKTKLEEGELDKDLGGRINQAVKLYENLPETSADYILSLFSSEPQRKELPTLRELSPALGPSQSTFSFHFPEILKALKTKLEEGELDEELKTRIQSAIESWKKRYGRAEVRMPAHRIETRRSEVRSSVPTSEVREPEKIAVIGAAGFVGFTKSVLLVTDWGHDVIGMDIVEEKVEKLNKGEPVNYIPQMEELLPKALESGRLRFTTNLAEAIDGRELIFLALPTPQSDKGEADISFLKEAVRQIATTVKSGEKKILIIKSTAPPGTEAELKKEVERKIAERRLPHPPVIRFAREPEFLREGKEVDDDRGGSGRIVIAAEDPVDRERIVRLYEYKHRNPVYPRENLPIVRTDLKSAPLVKYAANGYRGTKISFINFVGWLTEVFGIDINEVADALGEDPRILRDFLNCGLGFGGSCFPKDFKAFIQIARKAGVPADLLLDVLAVNEIQWINFKDQIVKTLDGVKGKNIVILGGAFKPNTSDVREARSKLLIEAFLELGAHIRVFDPKATRELGEEFPKDTEIEYFYHPSVDLKYEGGVFEDADAIVLVTEWDLFKSIDFKKLKKDFVQHRKPLPHIFDGRNIWDANALRRLGFSYTGIGRAKEGVAEVNQEEFVKNLKEFFLALRISFMNLLAEVADREGANIRDIRRGLGYDPVVFKEDPDSQDAYLSPGLGFGGHALPSALDYIERLVQKHLKYLEDRRLEEYRKIRREIAQDLEFELTSPHEASRIPFITAIREINERQIGLHIEKAKEAAGGSLKGKKVLLMGLAFKPETFSIENAPSLKLIEALLKEGAVVIATDEEQQTRANVEREFSGQERVQILDLHKAIAEKPDLLILVTEWKRYKRYKELSTLFPRQGRKKKEESARLPLVDGRHFYDPNELAALGIDYYAVGIPSIQTSRSRAEVRNSLTPEQLEIVNQAAQAFGLTAENRQYLIEMWKKYLYPSAPVKMIVDRNKPKSDENVLLIAQLNEEERKQLGEFQYEELVKEMQKSQFPLSKDAAVTIYSLDGGLGESLGRRLFKEALLKEGLLSEVEVSRDKYGQIKLGAKGTDLGFIIEVEGKRVFVSIAEAKLLQLIHTADQKIFGALGIKPLVNDASRESYDKLLDKIYLDDRLGDSGMQRTYREVLTSKGIQIEDFYIQQDIPYIDVDTGNVVTVFGEKVKQPGGHGQIGFSFFYEPEAWKPRADGKKQIRYFANGDNLNASRLDPVIIEKMLKDSLPIVKLTTATTKIDRKGGKDAVKMVTRFIDGVEHTLLVPVQWEIAEVRHVKQEEEFSKAGQEDGRELFGPQSVGNQPFNTNIIIVLEDVLYPLLQDLKKYLDEKGHKEKYFEIIAPTRIPKPPKEVGGKHYEPVDGAIGHVIHNLNEFFMTTDDQRVIEILTQRRIKRHEASGAYRVLYFVNVPRTPFFTPTKEPFDTVMQAFSNYFKLNHKEWVLEETQEGLEPPSVKFTEKSDHYQELQNHLETLGRMVDLTQLKRLEIKGKVRLINATLIGDVEIVNETDHWVDLRAEIYEEIFRQKSILLEDGKLVLENVHIVFKANGDVEIKKLTSSSRSEVRTQQKDQPPTAVVSYKPDEDSSKSIDVNRNEGFGPSLLRIWEEAGPRSEVRKINLENKTAQPLGTDDLIAKIKEVFTPAVQIVTKYFTDGLIPFGFGEHFRPRAVAQFLTAVNFFGKPVYATIDGFFPDPPKSILGEGKVVKITKSYLHQQTRNPGVVFLDTEWLDKFLEDKDPQELFILLNSFRNLKHKTETGIKEPLIAVVGSKKETLNRIRNKLGQLLKAESRLDTSDKNVLSEEILPKLESLIHVIEPAVGQMAEDQKRVEDQKRAEQAINDFIKNNKFGVATLLSKGLQITGDANFLLDPDQVHSDDMPAVVLALLALRKAAQLLYEVEDQETRRRLITEQLPNIIPGSRRDDVAKDASFFVIHLAEFVQFLQSKQALEISA